jgi:hypothetical protein
MMKFIESKKSIISILSVVLLFSVFSNNANALTTTNNLKSEQKQSLKPASKEVFLVSKAGLLKSFENKGSLTNSELKTLLSLVGFKGQDLQEAWAVAKKESNGQPIRFNGDTKTGDSSYGIFQINMIGTLGPDRRDKFNLNSNADLLNPVINAQIAYHMSKGGKDWSAWHGITSKTKMWMSKFPN